MLICKDCGAVFEEKDLAGGKMTFSGSETEPPEYTDLVCPECGSDYYEEAAKCPLCGEYFDNVDACELCPDCQVKVVEGINEMAEKLSVGDVQDAKDAIITYIVEVLGW